jgi:hypothetical protein
VPRSRAPVAGKGRRARTLGLVAAGYLALSLFYWWHVWLTGHPTSSITCGCGDTAQGVWWMEWTPWALTHGHNPFLSQELFSRSGGVSALANTSALALTLLFAPVTLLFGPVASFNLANLLAPVASGTAMYAAAGKLTRLAPARVAAGALYAFSPFMLRNTVIGHLQLTWAFYPPLVFAIVMTLVTDPHRRPVRLGLWLAGITILQFFIGIETLALTAMAAGTSLGLGFAARPRHQSERLRRLATAFAVATGTAGVVLAYPIWLFVAGPRHVVGPVYGAGTSATLTGIIDRGRGIYQGDAAERVVGYFGAGGPGVNYLGVALLVSLAVSAAVWRRPLLGAVMAATAALAWSYSIHFRVWDPVKSLPLIDNVMPIRLTLIVDASAALLLALSIDGWWTVARRRASSAPAACRRWAVALFAAVLTEIVAGGLAPVAITYTLPLTVTTPVVPPWLLSSGPAAEGGSTLLSLPFSDTVQTATLFWQAKARFSYSMIGGWQFVPGQDGKHDQILSPFTGAFPILTGLSQDSDEPAPSLTAATASTLRLALRSWLPLVVAVVQQSPGSAESVGFMTAVIGELPSFAGGVWSWRLRALGPDRNVSEATLQQCLTEPIATGPAMAIPDCVLSLGVVESHFA